MGLILDTSIIIAGEKRSFDLPSFLVEEAPKEQIMITSITAAELMHGVHRAQGKRRVQSKIL